MARRGIKAGTWLRARWVETQTLRLRREALPGTITFAQIAALLTRAGRGERILGVDPPPAEAGFPDLEYQVGDEACRKAFLRSLNREPRPEAAKYLEIALMRLEEQYSQLRPQVVKGNPSAVRAGVRIIEARARLLGYWKPDPKEREAEQALEMLNQRKQMMKLVDAMSPEDRGAYLEIMERTQSRMAAS